jgi:hypothetical protein
MKIKINQILSHFTLVPILLFLLIHILTKFSTNICLTYSFIIIVIIIIIIT